MKATAAPRVIKLTRAQREALALVGEGAVHYSPGRTYGARSSWTRFSYKALIGAKFVSRTKSVDALMDMGLVDIAGSGEHRAEVVLTLAGTRILGVAGTRKSAIQLTTGLRIFAPEGYVARIVEITTVEGQIELRLGVGGLYFTSVSYSPYAPVLVAPADA